MPFNSFTFILFFGAVLVIHSLPLPWILRKCNLLAASYLFYAAWDPRYVTLLLFSTAINCVAAELIAHWDGRPRIRRVVLWASVVLNLGLLAALKYGNEVLGLWQTASDRFGFPYTPPKMTILLPIGLSFFTFQAMSYTIDVYRRTIKPASILDLALFISFFPVLLAGPILRAGQFVPQCASSRRATGSEFSWGLSLLTLGLFMKVTLADHLLSPVVRQVYDVAVHPDTLSAWTGTMAFAAQDYCDFAGYSTCAMGIAFCLGFVIPANFRAPFASIGFRDVWQRWHITLVAWMRDYVFNPLGGVYKGYTRAAVNVMIVMLLIGLWHGATVPFLIFGFLHGMFLIGETLAQRTRLRRMQLWRGPLGKFFLWVVTMTLCLIAFVFYRAASLEQARWILASMFGAVGNSSSFRLPDENLLIALVVAECLVIAHWLCRNAPLETVAVRVPWWTISVALAFMLVAITLSSSESQNFLYFQY
ncbi:MAG TPA: MBOAT family O-acyltransferase [Planctomycetaceae bacterium]|jgi:D-alanyl-lipoteichoic acid acyltransferase DltB (MBOAT superfamily)|nr:MBOAT family O-acyltransferase [Planctomycetaceae bacterium]